MGCMLRRKIGRLLAAAILTVQLTGCQFNTPESVDAAPELHIMLKMNDTFSAENNAYIKALEEEIGISLVVECPSPSSYNERLNVMMAMGDLPDIVQVNWNGEANLSMWAQNKTIVPVDLNAAPNIKSNIPKELVSMMMVGTGDLLYAIPGITTSYPYGVIIRKDWMDKFKLETPRTLDDFVQVMKSFTYKDPDENQKKDTYGITSWRLNQLGGVFAGAFQTDYLWNSIHADAGNTYKKAVLRENQKGYLDFLTFLREVYEQDLIDPSFATLQNVEERFIQGKIGMIGGYSNDTIALEKRLKQTVPDARLEWILPPGDYEGRVWNFTPESYGYSGIGSMVGENAVFVITRDADYAVALDFLDKMNTPEMITFSNLGIQGVHYQIYDANRNLIIRTPEQEKNAIRELWGISDTYRSESFAYLANDEQESTRLKYYQKKGHLLITNPYSYSMGLVSENTDFQKKYPGYKDFERTYAIRYVTGEITLEQYTEAIAGELPREKAVLEQKINEKYQKFIEDAPIK